MGTGPSPRESLLLWQHSYKLRVTNYKSMLQCTTLFLPFLSCMATSSIYYRSVSYPDSSGFLVSGWSQGETPEFYYRKLSAVKQCRLLQGSQSKSLIFSNFPESLLATNRWSKSLRTLSTRLITDRDILVSLTENPGSVDATLINQSNGANRFFK